MRVVESWIDCAYPLRAAPFALEFAQKCNARTEQWNSGSLKNRDEGDQGFTPQWERPSWKKPELWRLHNAGHLTIRNFFAAVIVIFV